MRKLIMWNVVTMDGLFEGEKSWDLPGHELVWGDELEQFSLEQGRSAAALILGRVTYEGFAEYWGPATGEVADMMNRLPKIVFSRTLESAGWANSSIAADPPATAISALKQQGEGDLFVFGSGDLCQTLIEEDLFDEYRLCVTPMIQGKGRRLFKETLSPRDFTLLESRPLATVGVILRYAPASMRSN